MPSPIISPEPRNWYFPDIEYSDYVRMVPLAELRKTVNGDLVKVYLTSIKDSNANKTVREMVWLRLVDTSGHYHMKAELLSKPQTDFIGLVPGRMVEVRYDNVVDIKRAGDEKTYMEQHYIHGPLKGFTPF
ncbi:hypothetical protein DLP3_110 [Stenotrophomonas phage vB_SmaS_DLP_3]|nr:hypothetical protein DLP3_110 [Stenotrophomonas phage vB_SmaS_DLP_3]